MFPIIPLAINREKQLKICRRCNERKVNNEFNKSPLGVGGLQSYCKPCYSDWHRLRTYGIEAKEYKKLLAKQKGKCAICGVKMVRPVVDHNHQSKAIRGILCSPCNTGIGHLRDNPIFAIEATKYLVQDLMRGRQ